MQKYQKDPLLPVAVYNTTYKYYQKHQQYIITQIQYIYVSESQVY
jgi:hypothetical protein